MRSVLHDRLLDAWVMLARRVRGRERGQSLVEFALIVPIVVVLIMVAVDGGRAVLAYNTLANAARHGARVAAVNQLSPANTVTTCREDMPIEDLTQPHWSARACAASTAVGLSVTPADVTLTYAPPTDVAMTCSPTLHVGCIASLTVTARFQAITPLVGSILGTINLSANSQFPLERVFP